MNPSQIQTLRSFISSTDGLMTQIESIKSSIRALERLVDCSEVTLVYDNPRERNQGSAQYCSLNYVYDGRAVLEFLLTDQRKLVDSLERQLETLKIPNISPNDLVEVR